MQLAVILLFAINVINLGYGFEDSCRPLGDYGFVSEWLGGPGPDGNEGASVRNRFAGTWSGTLPVPFPANYVMGVDLQRWDFEGRMWSYLAGQWRLGGWWHYYLYALAVKVPLGAWIVALAALVAGVWDRRYRAPWRDEMVLLAPALVLFVLVSSQTGFNHHLRYVLPAFPFGYVWMSRVARAAALRHHVLLGITLVGVCGSISSSLWIYPHSISYFNELAGGPVNGHAHLEDSNIDWGQDLLFFQRWQQSNPEARPLRLAYYGVFDPRCAGIECLLPPPGSEAPGARGLDLKDLGPQPGWYAVSVNRMCSRTREYAYFLRFAPVAMAGYSIYIYHITPDEANRVRRELGLPEIGGADVGRRN